MFARLLSAALLFTAAAPAQAPAADARMGWALQCKDWDKWDKPAPPFRVYGDTWYVGTCGIAAILVTGEDGDILIDGRPANAGDLVAANIRKLGFKLSDVKILLHTHEHSDHAGGLARLKQLTGAPLYASPHAATALEKGASNPQDPQFASHNTFPAVTVDKLLRGDAFVTLGDLTLKALATPGHTPGALTWQWRSCESDVCKTIVYADSLTPVSSESYRFSDHPAYLAAFRASLTKRAALRGDILLSPHPSASGMRDRLLKRDLTDPGACKAYSAGLRLRLDERLAKEADGG